MISRLLGWTFRKLMVAVAIILGLIVMCVDDPTPIWINALAAALLVAGWGVYRFYHHHLRHRRFYLGSAKL